MDQPRVFISYRREECAGHAGRLRDSLCARFGDDHVFMDLEMAPGIDFVDELTNELGRCDVLLVLIGRAWLSVRDAHGRLRLEDPEDFVRREVETALARPDVLVVPVLVQGTAMPAPDQLPETLRQLARRNALELSDARWSFDVERLASHLRRKTVVVRLPAPASRQYGVMAAFLAGAAVAWLPTWGVQRAFINLDVSNREVVKVLVKGALQRGVTWAVFAAIVAAWAVFVARAGRPVRAAAIAFVIAFLGAGLGGAFTQLMRDQVPSFTSSAVIIGYIIAGATVTFAVVHTAARPARAPAFLLGIVAGALCGYVRTRFGASPSTFAEAAEVGLQALAIGCAAVLAVVLSQTRRSAVSPTVGAARLTGT